MRSCRPALALLAAGLSACGEGVPLTAPTGASLTIEALPKSIPATGGQSTITVIGFRSEADGGGTLPNGTQIFFTTDLGIIDEQVTMQGGIARAALRSNGRAGTATVRALSGFREDDISTTVEIGGGSDNVVIRVTANPTTLGPGDFSSEIVATLTDNRGNPLADDPVIFSTDAGALASAGSVLRTNASGQAFDRLTLLANEDSATVTVTSGSAVPGTVNVTRGDFGDPLIDSVSPSSGVRGASLIVTVTGQRFQPGVTASFGTGIAIDDVDWISSETLRIRIRIDPSASTGARTVTVTNPDGESASLASAFVVQ